jgi:hypothetical protein
MTQEQLIEKTLPLESYEVDFVSNNDFLDDLYNKTFFDTKIIDELEDYLIQNKLIILKIK